MMTPAPCIICGRELEEEGNNQPVSGLAFECRGHWPSAIWDHGGSDWLEINICEPCLRVATERGRVLNGDKPERRSPATYKKWTWPKR